MQFPKKAAIVTALSALLLEVLLIPAQAANAAPSDTTPTSLRPGDTYLLSDPALLAEPAQVADTLARDGDLSRLGATPTSGPTAADRPATVPKAASDRGFTVPSQRFARGRAPLDRYQHIENRAECAANETSGDDEGWIKNRFSYCQRHLLVVPLIKCRLSCGISGLFVSRNTIIGKAYVDELDGDPRRRYADFDLHVDVQTLTGDFRRVGSTMEARLECDGSWDDGRGDADDACAPLRERGRVDSPQDWQSDGDASFTLVSRAASAPSRSAGEQIAHGDFRPRFRFAVPGYLFVPPTAGEEGRLRFDSAWYQQGRKTASVFSDATPSLRYDRSDTSNPDAPGEPYIGVAAVADHIGDARSDPGSTLPSKTGKQLPGAEPSDPLHRLAPTAGTSQRVRYGQNRREVRNYCRSGEVPGRGPGMQCDEYPFASSYEGAARYQYDGVLLRGDYSVRHLSASENEEAGRRLGAWYRYDRILDEDPFTVTIGR